MTGRDKYKISMLKKTALQSWRAVLRNSCLQMTIAYIEKALWFFLCFKVSKNSMIFREFVSKEIPYND